jgi:hypothetical protein
VAVFALGYLHLVCLQALLPVYRGSYWYFDWWMHYDEARVFLGLRDVRPDDWAGYTLASRTPLFNLTTAAVMSLAGDGFEVYQLASVLPSCCFILTLYLLLRDLFGRRAAWLALLLAPLNLWMMHNAWFTWPKMLAAYYLLFALFFYLRWLRAGADDPARADGSFACFWGASLLGYMTHQVGLVYVLPLFLHAAVRVVREPGRLPGWKPIAAMVLLSALTGGAWYGWLARNLGAEEIIHSTPFSLGDASARFRPQAIATWMGYNLAASVVPLGAGGAFVADLDRDAEPSADYPVLLGRGEHAWFLRRRPDLVELYRGLTQLYFSLLSGALTISLSVFLLAAGLRRLRRLPPPWAANLPTGWAIGWGASPWTAVWLFVVVGTLGAAFLHPGKIPWGIAHSAAFPTALLLAALGWGVLSRAGPVTGAVVCCDMAAEFFLMFWSYWWLLVRDPGVLEDLPGNAAYVENFDFLNGHLGWGQYLFLAGALAIQVALRALLVRSWRGKASPVAREQPAAEVEAAVV